MPQNAAFLKLKLLTEMKASFLILFLLFKVIIGDLLERYLIDNLVLTYKLFREHSNAVYGNFLFSPILTQNVLALAALGAGKETAKEIIKAANLPNGLSAITEMYSHLQKILSSTSSLSIYNEIFTDINELNSRYVYLTKAAFNAVITNQGIKQIEKFTLSVNELVLSNGKGISSHLKLNIPWRHNFVPYGDDFVPFFDENGRRYDIKMIYARTYCNFGEDATGKLYLIELPFVDDNFSLTFVFPKKKEDIKELKESFPKLLHNQTKLEASMDIIVPEFGMSFYSSLTSMLKLLGINLAFSEKADFSGISNFPQKIEDGMEMNTLFNITQIPVVGTSMDRNRASEHYFPINQPFIYFLRHKVLGFLMIGRFFKPTETEVIQDIETDDIEFNIMWPEQMYIF